MLHLAIPFEEKPKPKLPGDNLRYYRLRKRLATRQLAEQIDVVPATIFMYEQNKHPILYDVENAFSKALEIDAGILYNDFADFLAAPYREALKSIRLALRISQKAFAEHIGVIPSYYYKLEAGHRRPSRKVYLRVVELLNQTYLHHSLLEKHTLQ